MKTSFNRYKSGTQVLVEGRPGSGKNTFVQKIAIDWYKWDMLKGAKMTFFIPLQLLSVDEVEESLVGIKKRVTVRAIHSLRML